MFELSSIEINLLCKTPSSCSGPDEIKALKTLLNRLSADRVAKGGSKLSQKRLGKELQQEAQVLVILESDESPCNKNSYDAMDLKSAIDLITKEGANVAEEEDNSTDDGYDDDDDDSDGSEITSDPTIKTTIERRISDPTTLETPTNDIHNPPQSEPVEINHDSQMDPPKETSPQFQLHIEPSPEDQTYASLLKQAKTGDPGARTSLAALYWGGGVEGKNNSLDKALSWWTKAAKQGYAAAQTSLGTAYMSERRSTGEQTEQQREFDTQRALKWWTRAARQGDVIAMHNLGVTLMNGVAQVPVNQQEAVEWFMKAARAGHRESQNQMGVALKHGKGVPCNVASAVPWFELAVAQQCPDAQNNLALMLWSGHSCKVDQRRALDLWQQSAAQGNLQAQCSLGAACMTGWRGHSADPSRAVSLWFASATGGNANAMFNLSKALEQGHGVTKNGAASREWCKKAAERGHEQALVVMQARKATLERRKSRLMAQERRRSCSSPRLQQSVIPLTSKGNNQTAKQQSNSFSGPTTTTRRTVRRSMSDDNVVKNHDAFLSMKPKSLQSRFTKQEQPPQPRPLKQSPSTSTSLYIPGVRPRITTPTKGDNLPKPSPIRRASSYSESPGSQQIEGVEKRSFIRPPPPRKSSHHHPRKSLLVVPSNSQKSLILET